jgi:predicted dehydrogenase
MEAMWTKFIPLHNHLKELVDSGAIGKLRLIEANFGFPRTYDTSHRLFAKELGGGSSLDQGVYTTTLNRWFADAEISELKATGFNYENGTDATAMTDFIFANGVRGRGNSSLATAFGLGARICGDEAIIEIDEACWNATTARIKRYVIDTDQVDVEEIEIPRRGAGYVHMLEAVSTSVLAGEIENEKHPHSFTLEVMQALDEVRSQIS